MNKNISNSIQRKKRPVRDPKLRDPKIGGQKTKTDAHQRGKVKAVQVEELKYVALYKPYGMLSQFTGEVGQKTLAEIDVPKGVYAAGRLDRDSEGLLLLSNDGPFIDKLIHPRNGHSRSYLVQVENLPNEAALQQLRQGVTIKGYQTKPCRAELVSSEPSLPPRDPPIRERKNIPTAWIRITLTEGKNRQVRRMTAVIGHPTLRLVREAIGKLQLGDLQPGEWKEVSAKDIL